MKTPQGPMADLFSCLTMEQKFSVMQLYSLCNVTCFENFKKSKISYEILMTASKSLGVSILYLSPIVYSQSTHRYDTSDYEVVDDNK